MRHTGLGTSVCRSRGTSKRIMRYLFVEVVDQFPVEVKHLF